MKIFATLFFTSLFCYSQNNIEDKLLFQSIVNIEGKKSYSYCRESVDLSGYVKKIKRKEFYERVVDTENIFKRDTILKFTITDSEVQSILKQIRENKNYVFPENLLQNSVSIAKDSVKIYMDSELQKFYKEGRAVFDTKDSLKIKEFREKAVQPYDYRHRCYVNFLSKPIYIRNNTVALVSNTIFCNSGGDYQLAFYEKKDNEWVEIVAISRGAY